MPEETHSKLAREIVAETLEIDMASVTESASIDTIREWTSIMHVLIIHAVESRINRSLSIEDTLDLMSINGIARVLRQAQSD